MKAWLITLALLTAAVLLALEVLGTVCPWLTRRERIYTLGLSVAVWMLLHAAFVVGEVSS